MRHDRGTRRPGAGPLAALTNDVKWLAKCARQNGAHVTPTFMVDGLVVADMESGETVEAWLGRLGMA